MNYLPSDSGPDWYRPSSMTRGGPKPLAQTEWAPNPQQQQPPSQFLEYWNVLRANLGWISMLAVIGAGLGWLVAVLQPSLYEARTVLDIRSLNQDFLNPHEGSPIGASGSGVLPESYIQTEIKILSSESLRKRALNRLVGAQQATPMANKSSNPIWQFLFGRFDAGVVPFKTLAADAAKRVKVRAVGNTRIVEILCDARDGQLAANMCNNLAQTYIQYNIESRYQSTRETGDWLQSQLDDVRKRLTKAENDLKDSSKETDFLFDSDSTDNPAEEKLRQLQTELERAQADRITKESDFAIASTRPAESLPMALDSGPIREYRMQLQDLKRQLADLRSTMTPQHYKVRELEMQIAEVEKALDTERDNLISRLKGDYETAKRRESTFSGLYQQQAGQVSVHADKAVRYNMLKREVESDRKLYEQLLQKVDEVGLAAALRTSTISVVDPAVAPTAPYSPKMVANVGLGFLAGSVLGLAFSLLRLRSDRTLHGPGDVSAYLQLRELGVIPSVEHPMQARMLLDKVHLPFRKHQLSPGEIREHLGEDTPEQALRRNSPSTMALATWLRIPEVTDAFFGTMSSLRFATARGERANVVVLTSPDAGEGKTTVATNLAITLAEIGQRVILVDGDLRRPGLDTIFDSCCTGGLAAILDSDEPIEDLPLENFIYNTPIPNLTLLPTKADREGICTKLHSSRMRVLVKRLRRTYDSVIIDSPPMLPFADARILGWLADGVLLVFRARKTTRDAALAAYEQLVDDGVHVLGTVLNDWNPRKSEKYNAYKSGYNVVA